MIGLACLVMTGTLASDARSAPSADVPLRSVDTRDFSRSLDHLAGFLTERDVALYRQIHAVQERGDWKKAEALIKQVSNDVLLGHVRAQKLLHPTKYRSSYRDLLFWMRAYADHPQAARIYRLALKRRPDGWKWPPKPEGRRWADPGTPQVAAQPYRSDRSRSTATRRAVTRLKSQMRKRIGRGWPTGAYRILATERAERLLDPVEFALARAGIAHGYFVFGKDEKALKLAQKSVRQSARSIPQAAWTGGLAAWRLGRPEIAVQLFPKLATAADASPSSRAAGAFWAARSYLALRQPWEAERWLMQAATAPETFHGLLARRILGVGNTLDWRLPPVNRATLEQLHAVPGVRRALGLLRVGDHKMAEEEFRRALNVVPQDLQPAIMTISARQGLARLAMSLAGQLHARGHRRYLAALFPDTPWAPPDSTGIDTALVHAIIRLESKFNPRARSRRGARGLMQLMPRTASYVSRKQKSGRSVKSSALYDPEINVELGSRYVSYLISHKVVNGDLLKLLAAYNAGPGMLSKWKRTVEFKDDPLLFIESLPSPETRRYIVNVLRSLWLYRLKRGEPTPSLDHVAAGRWPKYESVETGLSGKLTRAGD